jgi:oxygen-independent coproporphyrinogen III oxidase
VDVTAMNGISPTSPRSAYIHVPFCRHRCGYCNFTLIAGRDELIPRFLTALETELSWLGKPREVETLFLGGGTPTHLRGDDLRRLLGTLLQWHPTVGPSENQPFEFSAEANPSDLDAETVGILAEHGVNRISLGAQSFDSEKLRLLERDHQSREIVQALELARNRGISVSIDLIFGAPGESLKNWQHDLAAAIALGPDHISTSGLTFEQGTSFWTKLEHGALAKIDEELERQMYERAIDQLTAAGFEHYEVSNFARPGNRCRHNETYWLGGEYFAAGPGAARHVAGVRETNDRSVLGWLHSVEANQSPVAEREELCADDKARELLVFALRRLEGMTREWFTGQTGLTVDALVGEPLQRFVAAGHLCDDGRRISLSRQGLLVSDSLWPHFLSR